MHQFLWQYYTAYETPCFCQALRTIFETRVICAKHTHTNACVCMCGRLHGLVKITVNSSNRNVSLILLFGVSITVAAASVWCVCVCLCSLTKATISTINCAKFPVSASAISYSLAGSCIVCAVVCRCWRHCMLANMWTNPSIVPIGPFSSQALAQYKQNL